MFILKHGANIIILLLYVDDIMLTSSSSSLLQHIIQVLKTKFAMSDLGKLNYFLGIQVTYNSEWMFLDQAKYANLLEKSELQYSKPIETLTALKHLVSSSLDSPLLDDPRHYRSIVGAL